MASKHFAVVVLYAGKPQGQQVEQLVALQRSMLIRQFAWMRQLLALAGKAWE